MNTRIKLAISGLVALALLASGLLGAVAFAQTPTPPSGQPTTPPAQPTAGDTFWTALASKLGVSADTVRSAVRDAAKAVVAQALKNGKLTQTQADNIDARIDKMPLNQLPVAVPGLPRPKPSKQQVVVAVVGRLMLDSAAHTLGMSRADLVAELRDGLTLAEIAQQKSIDANKLKASMLAAANARVDQAVTNGKLTQDQATQLKTRIADRLDLTKHFPLPPKGKTP